jgi:hypothetical protein
MKAPVGLLSDRTVLHSKMEGLCPDKFQFTVLLPSRVWGRHAPTRPRLRSNERPSGAFEWQPGLAQQDRGASPRQGLLQNAGVLQKCSPGGTQHFQELKICGHGTVLALYIFGILGKGVLLWILKSNGCQAIRLNCLTGLTLKDRFFVEAVALHEYQLKRLMSRG